MPVLESIKKSLVGDKATEIIKSGTLLTTRGTAVVAVSLIGVAVFMEFVEAPVWNEASPDMKLWFVIATGVVWAIVAAADSIARGIATAATARQVVRLPAGLRATRLDGADSRGWAVLAMTADRGGAQESVRFLVAKGDDLVWLDPGQLQFDQRAGRDP